MDRDTAFHLADSEILRIEDGPDVGIVTSRRARESHTSLPEHPHLAEDHRVAGEHRPESRRPREHHENDPRDNDFPHAPCEMARRLRDRRTRGVAPFCLLQFCLYSATP